MRLRAVLSGFLLLAGVMGSDVVRSDGSMKLLSITGVVLGKGHGLLGISLDMTFLRVLAVCQVPSGWGMNLDAPSGPLAWLKGEGSGSVTELRGDELEELRGLLLVEKWDEGEVEIKGSLDVDRQGDLSDIVTIPLAASNIVLENADRCSRPET